jgi:HEPN domain-containing protein
MSDEARVWIRYAQDNLHVAELCLDHGLFNPSVQNAQQAVEKSLKAMSVAAEIPIEKTHNVSRLVWILAEKGTKVPISQEECELLDSVYLPSKYPVVSVLPDFEPDHRLARQCLDLARKVVFLAQTTIQGY